MVISNDIEFTCLDVVGVSYDVTLDFDLPSENWFRGLREPRRTRTSNRLIKGKLVKNYQRKPIWRVYPLDNRMLVSTS